MCVTSGAIICAAIDVVIRTTNVAIVDDAICAGINVTAIDVVMWSISVATWSTRRHVVDAIVDVVMRTR